MNSVKKEFKHRHISKVLIPGGCALLDMVEGGQCFVCGYSLSVAVIQWAINHLAWSLGSGLLLWHIIFCVHCLSMVIDRMCHTRHSDLVLHDILEPVLVILLSLSQVHALWDESKYVLYLNITNMRGAPRFHSGPSTYTPPSSIAWQAG